MQTWGVFFKPGFMGLMNSKPGYRGTQMWRPGTRWVACSYRSVGLQLVVKCQRQTRESRAVDHKTLDVGL